MKTIVVLIIAAFCAALGDTFLSYGMRSAAPVSADTPRNLFAHLFVVVRNPHVTVGVVFMACFFYLYLAALSWGDLSFVKPITSLSFLFATVFAALFLREQVSWHRWLGTLLILLGVLAVSLDRRVPAQAPEQAESPVRVQSGRR
jgi:uncharacterized membrane protein